MKNIFIVIILFISCNLFSQRIIGDSLMCFTKPEIVRIGTAIQELNDSIDLQSHIIAEKDYQLSVYNEIILRDTSIINQLERDVTIKHNVILQDNLYLSKVKKRGIYGTIGGIIFGTFLTFILMR